MVPPPPPPPPAPPPSLLNATVPHDGGPVQGKKPAALLADIQRGAKLRKVSTNDRSAPQIGEKSSSSSNGNISTSNQLEREPKPGTGGGVRVGGSNSVNMGSLFVNGLPSKPSDNKFRRGNTSVSTPAVPSPPSPFPPVPFGEMRPQPNNVSPVLQPSTASKSTDLNMSVKPSPPPPPIQSVKPPINSNSNGRDQFKTLRPMKSESSISNSNLRRSGSSEDFSSSGSAPSRGPVPRPAFHPPSARPSAPPPPPPLMRVNENKTSDQAAPPPPPPPPPVVRPVTPTLTSRFGSCPAVTTKGEEGAPPPPPRTASKATSSVSSSTSPLVSKFVSRDVHPLDRFTFKPLSSLPPPPFLSQSRTS